jgi:thermitase
MLITKNVIKEDRMKKLFVSLALVASSCTFAANHNGYIVKLKDSAKSLGLPKSIKSLNSVTTSFGTFTVVDGSQKSIEGLANHPAVEYVEPNWVINLDTVDSDEKAESATDSKFKKQWGFQNTGRNSGGFFGGGKKGEDVKAVEAWEITKGREDVVVAVIDTGIDYRHSDLKDNMWVNSAELNGQEGVDDDGNGYVDDVYGYDFSNMDGDPMDGHSHGTHCAGNIGASHNGRGVMGMMANVKLMGIKFLSDRGSGETIGAIKSIEYAIKNGAHIMSNSWGGGERSDALKEAIEAARDAGILFVAAAGNSRSDNDKKPTYPANYKVDNVITVGASTGKGARASFSNYGAETVHVFAPGSGIYSTVKNNKYKNMSGTSMATPIVSGALGLLLANEPGISYLEAKKRLMETTDNPKSLDGLSVAGRINTYRMLRNEK